MYELQNSLLNKVLIQVYLVSFHVKEAQFFHKVLKILPHASWRQTKFQNKKVIKEEKGEVDNEEEKLHTELNFTGDLA